MTATRSHPRVIFPDGYDERAELETPLKGGLDGVVVQTEDGSKYSVSFIDPIRLQQDMEEYAKLGTPWFSEPGLIILAEVNTAAIHQAVRGLWERGYFASLQPLDKSLAATVSSANKN